MFLIIGISKLFFTAALIILGKLAKVDKNNMYKIHMVVYLLKEFMWVGCVIET